ncbi:hypothetical protein [Schleiferilactobacillus perolens]|jgi:hypothetical protein|uniref:hypothetical protein n=1 Tax=Schleiferilactobacillus perolens TaxID=100468 RepID=UPI002356F4F5|nr:hypothetical protein [Schleiferilactobacillus perolens]MCI2172119.1 hypothetical protein [Schleiferilactobacillus perolens]
MVKAQQKFLLYAKTINDLVDGMTSLQEKMDPDFQTVKNAITEDAVKEMPEDKYMKIIENFTKGTDGYRDLLATLQKSTVPARLMGNHHLFMTAFRDFIAGCQAMIDSMHDDRTIDVAAFDDAEKAQDKATDEIGKYLGRVNQLV